MSRLCHVCRNYIHLDDDDVIVMCQCGELHRKTCLSIKTKNNAAMCETCGQIYPVANINTTFIHSLRIAIILSYMRKIALVAVVTCIIIVVLAALIGFAYITVVNVEDGSIIPVIASIVTFTVVLIHIADHCETSEWWYIPPIAYDVMMILMRVIMIGISTPLWFALAVNTLTCLLVVYSVGRRYVTSTSAKCRQDVVYLPLTDVVTTT